MTWEQKAAALFGASRWRKGLALIAGVSVRTVHRWSLGQPDQGIVVWLDDLVETYEPAVLRAYGAVLLAVMEHLQVKGRAEVRAAVLQWVRDFPRDVG